VELCGGTHVRRTGEIGMVRIVGEGAVSAGVRRLEALTGGAARHYLAEQERRLKEVASILKVAPGDVVERARALAEERRRLERELAEARRRLASGAGGGGGNGAAATRDIGGIAFIGRTADGLGAKDLKGLADEAKREMGSGVVTVVGRAEDGKAAVVVGVTDDLTARFSAIDLVRLAAESLGGKGGGGRPDLAQAGGPDGANAAEAIEAVAGAIAAEVGVAA
jgi:alanyl-tRNA synthetase